MPGTVAAYSNKATVVVGLVLLASAVYPAPGQAQRLYKYRDTNGVWVYTDRQPGVGQSYEEAELARTREVPEVRLYQRAGGEGVALFAQNTYHGPVQIAFELTRMENLADDTPRRGLQVLAARSEAQILTLRRADPAAQMSFEYQFQYIPGDPRAEHQPRGPYRIPYALATGHPVSQAPPDSITHADPSSEHAIDFVMPVGTGLYAARDGTVIEVASDYYDAGVDPEVDGPRANMIRILHEDGTMALYAHLNWNSIRVVPGQRVTRGEYLADSGNTGFSTGPHLHFVVQRNRNGAIVSVPVQFTGPQGAVTLGTGDRPVAY